MYVNMYARDYTLGANTAYAYAASVHKQNVTGFLNSFLHLAPEIWHTLPTLFYCISIHLYENVQYRQLLMICEDIKLDKGTMQPLHCPWHHLHAILYSVF